MLSDEEYGVIKSNPNNIIIFHLLIIKYLSEKYPNLSEADKTEIYNFFNVEGQLTTELVNYVGITHEGRTKYMKTFGNSTNFDKAKESEGNYDYFNSIFYIKERSEDTTTFSSDIVYLNAYKNCLEGFTINRFGRERLNFLNLIENLMVEGIRLEFKKYEKEIQDAIDKITIFQNKKEKGKDRDKRDCNNTHESDKEIYKRMAKYIASLPFDNEITDTSVNIEDPGSDETGSDVIEGGFKRKTQKRKTQKRKTQKRKTKKRNYKQKRRY